MLLSVLSTVFRRISAGKAAKQMMFFLFQHFFLSLPSLQYASPTPF